MLRSELADILHADGHDVVRAAETGLERADDHVILQRAVKDERILITVDGDFGDWVVLPLSEHFGVVRVRIHPTSTENISKLPPSSPSQARSSRFSKSVGNCLLIEGAVDSHHAHKTVTGITQKSEQSTTMPKCLLPHARAHR